MAAAPLLSGADSYVLPHSFLPTRRVRTHVRNSHSTACSVCSAGLQRWFYLNRSLSCGHVFETYCDRMGISLGSVKFLHKGTRIFGADTPEALQVGPAGHDLAGKALAATWMGTGQS